ncbi:O-antigen ligase [Agromyces sp. CF514]|uniref:O-antigen ligase family protein n=1 Tax=Agromyces sp. CF514 TaxID=1881031 RepID=UPI0008E391FA|nr:O-antigen ligase family protein [Agromyces sp. CF514]SFR86480.1 O-antigen ligase [Agromyces sp. CF514]
MTPARRPALAGAYATFVLFTAFAGQFWRNLLGWWGFGAAVAIVVVGGIVLLVHVRPGWKWRRTPKSTLAFLLLAALSLLWSFYPGATALGLAILLVTTFAAVTLVLCLPWSRIVMSLASAIKWILALSIAFELWVAVFVREPLLPNFPDFDVTGEKLPMAFYWSRGLLLHGGPIEGIVASRNLLGMIALLGLIVFGCLLAAGSMRRAPGISWLVVAGLVFALTRSSTMILVAALVAVVLVFALWTRRVGAQHRRKVYWAAAGVVAASVTLLALSWNLLLQLFGKGEDLTGRTDIWASVIDLAQQRPIAGWGYVGYWVPWVEPFKDLAVRKGVTYLQAHNAWLDVWMQLGVLGLIAFLSIVIGAVWRSWFLAVDQPRDAAGRPLPYSTASLLPLLVLFALLGQSLAESRLLIEIGWLLLIAIAWGTKRRQWTNDPLPAVPRPARSRAVALAEPPTPTPPPSA